MKRAEDKIKPPIQWPPAIPAHRPTGFPRADIAFCVLSTVTWVWEKYRAACTGGLSRVPGTVEASRSPRKHRLDAFEL